MKSLVEDDTHKTGARIKIVENRERGIKRRRCRGLAGKTLPAFRTTIIDVHSAEKSEGTLPVTRLPAKLQVWNWDLIAE